MADIPITDAEELARLREENQALRARNEQLQSGAGEGVGEGARPSRWRWPLAATLLVLSGLLLAGSVLAIWAARTVLDTDRYTETVTPLIDSPAVRDSVASTAVDRLFAAADVETRAREALPPRADFLAPSIATNLRSYSLGVAEDVLASDQARQLWVSANRRAHAAIVPALLGEGRSRYVDVDAGVVSIDVSQIVAQVKQRLVDRGVNVVERVPDDVAGGSYTLFQSDSLAQVQAGLRFLQGAAIVLPILTVLVIVAAIALAPDRLRAALWLGVVAVLSMVLLAIGVALLRDFYVGSVDRLVLNSAAAAALFDTLARFLRNALRVVAAIGVVVAIAAALAGSSRWATSLRRTTTEGIGSISQRSGLDLGGFSLWVDKHRRALDILAVVVVAAILLAVEVPSPGLVLGLAAAVVVWLLIVEFVARAHAGPGPYRGQPAA